jgi:hypothetical protein
MILEKGDMWKTFGKTDLFCFTANSTMTKNNRLVMGAGIAKQVKERIPDIDLSLGYALQQLNNSTFGLITHISFNQMIGAFQVKYHWSDKADLHLIMYSTVKLFSFIVNNKPKRIDLNFPGIGKGKLPEEMILPIISNLPDCVHVWKL